MKKINLSELKKIIRNIIISEGGKGPVITKTIKFAGAWNASQINSDDITGNIDKEILRKINIKLAPKFFIVTRFIVLNNKDSISKLELSDLTPKPIIIFFTYKNGDEIINGQHKYRMRINQQNGVTILEP